MSIRWIDGFGTYNRNVSYLSRKWATANLGSSTLTTGRSGLSTTALNYSGTALTTPSLLPTSIVNTSSTVATWVSGPQFNSSWSGAVNINGTGYTISGTPTPTSLSTTSSIGTHSGVACYLPASYTTWTVGFAFYNANMVSSLPVTILQVLDSASLQVDLRFNPSTGLFSVTNGTTTFATGAIVLLPLTWYYVEMQVIVAISSGGSIVTHINQATDINVSSITTATDSVAQASVFSFVTNNLTSGGYYLDDVYITDGGPPNSTFLNDMKVETVVVSAAGSYNAWTPNPNNIQNYQGVVALNDNRSVGTDTAGAIDTYVFNNLQIITGGIKAVQEVIWASNSDSNSHVLKSHLVSSGTAFDDVPQTTATTANLPYSFIQETDPATSIAWTVAGVNGCQFGLNLVS